MPVDYVADALVHLLDRREAGVFNLVAGRDAATVDELDRRSPASASAAACRRSSSRVEPGPRDDHGAVYLPYFDMDVVFDDARARAVLVRRASRRRRCATTSRFGRVN